MRRTSYAQITKFLDDVSKKRNRLGFRQGEECFYRGQAKRWPLLPSLFRVKSNKGREKGDLETLEYDLFYEFKLFPDLDGLAMDLRMKYRIDLEIKEPRKS